MEKCTEHVNVTTNTQFIKDYKSAYWKKISVLMGVLTLLFMLFGGIFSLVNKGICDDIGKLEKTDKELLEKIDANQMALMQKFDDKFDKIQKTILELHGISP